MVSRMRRWRAVSSGPPVRSIGVAEIEATARSSLLGFLSVAMGQCPPAVRTGRGRCGEAPGVVSGFAGKTVSCFADTFKQLYDACRSRHRTVVLVTLSTPVTTVAQRVACNRSLAWRVEICDTPALRRVQLARGGRKAYV